MQHVAKTYLGYVLQPQNDSIEGSKPKINA